jgi:hypothetical protein
VWRAIAVAIVAVLSVAAPASAASSPDPTLTPGGADPLVTQATIATTICKVGYTKTVRNVSTKVKSQVYDAYKIPKSDRGRKYVIDHLIPLEVGGSNATTNLWPEPKSDSVAKDRIEDSLHDRVCNGWVDLTTAQASIATDWQTAFATATTTTTRPRVVPTIVPTPPPTLLPTVAPTQAPAPTERVVTAGSFCSPVGATGVTSAGTAMVCSTTSKDGTPYTQPRWRSP